ncbi:MAG: replicative DNA helicase [Chloroflexi bacterium]|nr:replicative DNA helicase [Chloroflexota bacterium]
MLEARASEKSVPADIAAEEAVLGSILLDPEAIDAVMTVVEAADFSRTRNAWIFEACVEVNARGDAINQITVAHELARIDRLESAGGIAYLGQLMAAVPTSVHAVDYAQIVQRTSMMRRLIKAAGEIAQIGYEEEPDVDRALAKAEEILFQLRNRRGAADFVHIRDVLDRYFEESGFQPRTADGELPHIPTGFVDLDRLLGGLQRSDLVILAARPSLGKSSLALSIVQSAAVHHGARAGIFSLEMSKEQLVQRLLASESDVDSTRLRLGIAELSRIERQRVMQATGVLAEAPIYINDSPTVRIAEMTSKARRLQLERGLDLVVVDYLQLIRGSSSSNRDNRVQEISEISRSLKAMARELSVPVLALSQLSRAVESRSPHIPMLSDLRESGSIEQDADVVMFIYRDDVYYTEEDWEKQHPGRPYPKGIADIIVAKHRNGPTGKVSLIFFEKTTKFASLGIDPGVEE